MRVFITGCFLFLTTTLFAQQGWWTAQLHRKDGNTINFTFEWKTEKGKSIWYIHNAAEKIKVDNITATADSFVVQMPVFESQFRLVYRDKKLSGNWIKGGSVKTSIVPFTAEPVLRTTPAYSCPI